MNPASKAQKPPRAPRLGDIVIACLGNEMAIASPLIFAPAVVTQHMAQAEGVPEGSGIEASIIVGGLAAQAMPMMSRDGTPIPMPRVQPANLVYSATASSGTWRFANEHEGPTVQMPKSGLH